MSSVDSMTKHTLRVRPLRALLAGAVGLPLGYLFAGLVAANVGVPVGASIAVPIGLLVSVFGFEAEPRWLPWRLVAGTASAGAAGWGVVELLERTDLSGWGVWLLVIFVLAITAATVGAVGLVSRLVRRGVGGD